MCGIFCSITSKNALKPDRRTLERLEARGPDSTGEHIIELPKCRKESCSNDSIVLTFFSTVLALRGDQLRVQPLVDEQTGSVLCWNGEAWKFGDYPVAGNDSTQVFALLLAASHPSRPRAEVSRVLTEIAGPFAFVYFDAVSCSLYYGRDRLGRRSLTTSRDQLSSLVISSISTTPTDAPCEEVDTTTIYVLDLTDSLHEPENLPWFVSRPLINKTLPCAGSIPAMPASLTVESLELHLLEALRPRVTGIPSFSCDTDVAFYSQIAILFSGGLDCTLLARLCHEILPPDQPIDLLNVAFENPRFVKAANLGPELSPFEACPDRITGRSSHAELMSSFPGRTWQFVAVNVPYTESLQHRSTIIDLMRPHATEMDLSIAMALYFAARGRGAIPGGGTYTTQARVLLSGLGADELFAGYTRHATAFSRGGYKALADELELDFTRLGSRNLGRDDRIISHWGREVRYPYLDESFLAFTLRLPVWEKCGFRTRRAESKHHDYSKDDAAQVQDLDPAKMLLRMLAFKLGMEKAAQEKKRAIQFGAKTAKMQIVPMGQGHGKGTDLVT